MKNGKLVIQLFPNSGHHLYFVPLAIGQGAGATAVQNYVRENNLPELSSESYASLLSLCAAEPDWIEPRLTSGQTISWLRGKFGIKQERTVTEETYTILGLWCAIETNVGIRKDGYIYDSNNQPAQADPNWIAWQKTRDQGSGYLSTSAELIDFRNSQIVDLETVFDLTTKLKGSAGPCTLEISWQPDDAKPVPVSLIVDFGNTRTIAFGLEMIPRTFGESFADIFRPIVFQRGHDDSAVQAVTRIAATDLIPDSWAILREPTFAKDKFLPPRFLWPQYVEKKHRARAIGRFLSLLRMRPRRVDLAKVINRVPFMFVKLSPVLIGPEATDLLANSNVSTGQISFLSSPKRYAWDNDPVGEAGQSVWYMYPRTGVGRSRQLEGELFRFLPRNNRIRRNVTDPKLTQDPPSPTDYSDETLKPSSRPSPPNFGRADVLIWSALAIIERAKEQIQSENWRFGHPVRRFLNNVVVTFPPGWTNLEFSAYWQAWSLAKLVHNWTRGPAEPKLALDLSLDEAVASQLAIVFSEIRHQQDRLSVWVNAYGRRRDGRDNVRVLTIDIGGGTVDTAVVQYSDAGAGRPSVHLLSEVLFNDSSTHAGDRLVKDLIETVLLPTLGERFRSNPGLRPEFEKFFARSASMREAEDRLKRMVITRSVFIPMVYKWLEEISNNTMGSPKSPRDCGASLPQIEKLNAMFRDAGLVEDRILGPELPFDIDYEKVVRNILKWCAPIANTHAGCVAAFECDVVIVTGKPSELPQVRELLEQQLPIAPDRIIFAKGYRAGEWFPGAVDGRISDAKMVTVVGAALYTAITRNLVPNWNIEHRINSPARNYWGVIPREEGAFQQILLNREQDEMEADLTTFCAIGRARFVQNRPEPVYVFRWRDRQSGLSRGTCTVHTKIRRVRQTPEGQPLKNEHLEITDVSGKDNQGEPIFIEDVELDLRSLPLDEQHWLDQGKFQVRWE